MKLKRVSLIIIILILLVTLLYIGFDYKNSLEYVDQPLPFYALDKTTNKIIYAESPKKIAESMLTSEEYFKGDLILSYLDIDKAEIVMRNYGTGDDSIAAFEYHVIAERKQQGWEITQFKVHWKCERDLFFQFWTTKACI